ncbi:MAG: NfeD family protein [Blastopirellula sp. JB062]
MPPIYFALLLLIIALGLIFLEFLLPSAGILGVLAFAAMLGSVGWAYIYCGPGVGTLFLGAAVILMPVVFGMAVKLWPHTPIGRLVLLNTPSHTKEDDAEKEHLARLVGKVGVATCALLPGGYADIEGESWNVVSESGAIESGEKIEVVEVDGTRIVVVLADDQASSARSAANQTDANDPFSKPIDSLGIDSLEDPFA